MGSVALPEAGEQVAPGRTEGPLQGMRDGRRGELKAGLEAEECLLQPRHVLRLAEGRPIEHLHSGLEDQILHQGQKACLRTCKGMLGTHVRSQHEIEILHDCMVRCDTPNKQVSSSLMSKFLFVNACGTTSACRREILDQKELVA